MLIISQSKIETLYFQLNLLPYEVCGGCGGLMAGAFVSRASSPGSSPGLGHCVVFLGKTLYFHSVSLHPGV